MGIHDPTRTAEMAIRRCEGATLQEIASVYGITRERVRQLLTREGLGAMRRRSRGFVPFNREEFAQRQRTARVIRCRGMRKSLQRYKGWRRQAVLDLKALAVRLGHTPRYADVFMFYHVDTRWGVHRLGGRWLGRSHGKRARGMHRWYRLAGLTPWPTGYAKGDPSKEFVK